MGFDLAQKKIKSETLRRDVTGETTIDKVIKNLQNAFILLFIQWRCSNTNLCHRQMLSSPYEMKWGDIFPLHFKLVFIQQELIRNYLLPAVWVGPSWDLVALIWAHTTASLHYNTAGSSASALTQCGHISNCRSIPHPNKSIGCTDVLMTGCWREVPSWISRSRTKPRPFSMCQPQEHVIFSMFPKHYFPNK